ncbi:MAG: HPr family phosphocarrier protein [Lawsonibacter sp.]|nr:HPr family phosphocarrier protein [Lawsonibacter sp.]
MKEFSYIITNPVGIHARPAALLVETARGLTSAVTVRKGERSASADRLMALMLLGVVQGDQVTVTLEGPEEEQDAALLEAFFRQNL